MYTEEKNDNLGPPLQLFFQTISSPLVIWLLIDPVSFLGSPLFLHPRKPKHGCQVMLSIIWPRSLGAWQFFHTSVPSPITVALSLLWFELSHFFFLISLFLSWIQRYYFFFRPCLCIKGKQSYSCERILFTDLYRCIFWWNRIFVF